MTESIAQEFADDLARVVQEMAGERPAVSLQEETGNPVRGSLAWRQRFAGLEGSAWVSTEERTSVTIGGRTLAAAGLDGSDTGIAKTTFAEILGQTFGLLSNSLSGRSEREWTCTDFAEVSEVPQLPVWTSIRLTFAQAEPESIQFAIDESLLEALKRPNDQPTELAPVTTGPRTVPNPKTLDLLLDVELPVSVSFGRTQLQLKDVIKLTSGSIVELNRMINEPVEVIVNNCVIARGEVVVVDGNFGVRIHHVISREERLRTVF